MILNKKIVNNKVIDLFELYNFSVLSIFRDGHRSSYL